MWWVRAAFDRAAAKKTEEQLAESLTSAGKEGGKGFSKSFLSELRKSFDKRMADLRVQVARGAIDPAEFKKQANLAAKEFNAGLLAGMDKARAAGKLTDSEYLKLSRTLKKVRDDGQEAGTTIAGSFKRLAAIIGSTFAIRQLVGWGKQFAGEAMAARHSLAQLEAAQKSTGGASGFTTAQLIKQAEALEKVSLFSKDAVQGGLTRLLTYTGIQGEMFERASTAALDMATRLGIDLPSAAEKVGNALNYPSKAINSLTRQGFRFTEQQQQQIKEMERAGNIAGAQAIIIGELELAYGGAAKAAADTVGPWRQVGLQINRLRESLGETILRMGEQSGAADKLGRVIESLADNTGTLVGVMLSLGKALVVGGVVVGVGRLAIAMMAVNRAIRATTLSLGTLVKMATPLRVFTLVVTGLTVAFEALGAKSRKAAEESARSLDIYRDALGKASNANVVAQQQAVESGIANLKRQRDALKAEVDQIETRFGRSGLPLPATRNEQAKRDELAAAERTLKQLEGQRVVLAEIAKARAEVADPPDPGGFGGDDKDAARQRERFAERLEQARVELDAAKRLREAQGQGAAAIEVLNTKLEREEELRRAVKDLLPEQAAQVTALVEQRHQEIDAIEEAQRAAKAYADEQATYDALGLADRQEAFRQEQAVAESRKQLEAVRQGIAAGAITVQTETNAALHEYNREQFIANALLQAGAVNGTAFAATMRSIAEAQYDAANRFVSPWQEGLDQLRNEIEGSGTLLHDLSQAWAEGGWAGVAQYAKAKVKENIAAAIENAAKALGAFGLGNPAAAGKYAAAAAKHTAAAAAWRGAQAAAGSGGGGAAAAGSGGAIANAAAGSNIQPPGPEVTIVLSGPGWDALNPRVQEVIHGAQQEARTRYGENARIRVTGRGQN